MRCHSSSSLIIGAVTYTESLDFADQFCARRRHHTESIQRRSRFSLLCTIRDDAHHYREYLQERRHNIDTFNVLLTRHLRVDEHLSLDSFQLLRHLGKGGYGSVFLAYHKESKEWLALKAIKKADLAETNEEKTIISERQYVFALHHPNIVQFITSFKDHEYVYIGLEWLSGGDLYSLMTCQKFTELQAQFYAGQIVMALDYLHGCKVVFRDLKPENIVLARRGYLKLIDLGLAKIIRGYSKTFCGTPHYIAPEVIMHRPYTTSPDYWTLGIIIQEMVTGDPPYDRTHRMHTDTDERISSETFSDYPSVSTIESETSVMIRPSSRHYHMYLRIVHGCSTLNRSDLSENCARLIRDLLRLNTEQRLGCGPRAALDVLEHPWFASMNFWHLYRQNYIAPYLPTRKSLLAAPEATDAVLRFTAKNHYEEEFRDF